MLISIQHFEKAILQALDGGLLSCSQENITIKTPRVFHFDRETNIQIMEDLPNSLDLKHFLLSELAQDLSEPSARSLGCSLGSWLRSFHEWGTKKEQRETRKLLNQNGTMKDLKFYINYSMLLDTIANFPGILEESRGVFGEVHKFAAAELKKEDNDDEYGLIHGDFWTGK
jgi:5-methylthioribose kinase